MRAFFAVITLFAMAGAASAQRPRDVSGWRSATWGMSEQEVLTTFKGEVSPLATPKSFPTRGEATLTTNMTIAGHSLRAYLIFGTPDRRLSAVVLREEPENSPDAPATFDNLRQQLTEKYGKPDDGELAGISRKVMWYFHSTKISIDLLATSVGGMSFTILTVIYEKPSSEDLGKL